MDLILKGRNIRLTDRVEEYAEKRFGKIRRLTHRSAPPRIRLDLFEEQNPKIEARFRATVRIAWDGIVLHGEARAHDVYTAIDMASDQMFERARRELERVTQARKGGRPGDRQRIAELFDAAYPSSGRADSVHQTPGAPSMPRPEIHRMKQFNIGPMTIEQAALQMELVGHDFFIFLDADTDATSVLYRRSDGSLGLIEPALHEAQKGA